MDTEILPKAEKKVPSRLVPVALTLLFLASAGFGFLRSSFFLVDEIEIHGLNRIQPEEITAVSGYAKNMNIFDVDLIALGERVSANPRVEKVQVKRSLPSTLVVNVSERNPAAVIPYSGYYILVDAEGLAMGMVESYRERDLPLITGVRPQQVLVGKQVEVKELRYALLVAGLLPPNVAKEVSEINFAEATGISVYMQSGIWVTLGLGTRKEYETRFDVLNSLLVKLKEEKRRATYIDVRFPTRPVVRSSK